MERVSGGKRLSRVDKARRIQIPKELCEQMDIRVGDEIEIALRGGRMELRKVETRCIYCSAEEDLVKTGQNPVCRACYEKLTRRNQA